MPEFLSERLRKWSRTWCTSKPSEAAVHVSKVVASASDQDAVFCAQIFVKDGPGGRQDDHHHNDHDDRDDGHDDDHDDEYKNVKRQHTSINIGMNKCPASLG